MDVRRILWPLLAATTLSLVACSEVKFSTRKEAVLSKDVLVGDDAAPDGTPPPMPQPTPQPAPPVMGSDEIEFFLVCSDARSRRDPNFKKALDEGLPIELKIDGKACTNSPSEIKSLVTKKSFTTADAVRLCPSLVGSDGKLNNVSLVIAGNAQLEMMGTITLVYALNKETEPPSQAADELCDQRASPLVVHFTSDVNHPKAINLSSQEKGVYFDLLGARNNYRPVRISWFTNHEYGFLALPNAAGEVRSIAQLFGNSTIGPDGRPSDNGYAALAKYDGMSSDGRSRIAAADGIIDIRDPVFAKLRLWIDRNYDGIGQASEMIALDRLNIAFVDLRFSTDYQETDRYGNQTLMKSVVGYGDGSLDLIFDLWFAYRLKRP